MGGEKNIKVENSQDDFQSSKSLNNKIIDWNGLEWFKNSHPFWFNDFLKWILLILYEPKDSQEQVHIEKGLKVLKSEVDELLLCNVGNWPDIHKIIPELFEKCNNWRLSHDEPLKNSIINEIVKRLRLEQPFVKTLVDYLIQLQVPQRSVLRFMVHQNIQARVAFARTTLKPHLDTYASMSYHCTNNPYFKKIQVEKEEIDKKYNELTNKNEKLKLDDAHTRSLLQALDEESEQVENQLREQSNQLKKYKEKVNKLKEQNSRLSEEMNQLRDDFNSEIQQSFEKQESFKHETEKAKKEVLFLQSALGDATNIRISDKSLNGPLQIIKDIDKFKQLLEDFSKTKGSSVEINESGARDLLLSYNVNINNMESRELKRILTSVLERLICQEVFSAAAEISKVNVEDEESSTDYHLESSIIYHTNALIRDTTNLSQKRDGNDYVAKITPIKIRQQVYEALSLRAFNLADVEHPYITETVDKLVKEVNKYRKILDEKRKNNVRKSAEELVRFGFKLWFGLQAQEPTPKVKFNKPGGSIKPHLMQGAWDKEEIQNYEVELCYFPSIVSKIGDQLQIYNKSEVLIRPKSKSNKTFNKLKSIILR
nr:14490_t:CDS:1 [Entrophospora candida]CAG8526532.1 2776_t:CDS:1 [Entrophospora candida]